MTLVVPDQASRLDESLSTLASRKHAWARLPAGTKIQYLSAAKEGLDAVARDWVAAASRAKGLLPGSALEGEEWISGPWATAYALDRYTETLRAIRTAGVLRYPKSRVHVRNGRTVVDAFPNSAADKILFTGIRAETYMLPGVTPQLLDETIAPFYRDSAPDGRVALVLGAGNIASIPPLDVLYKFIAGGAVCILKMNPVNEYLGPFFEQMFSAFVDAGFLRFAYGGADVGRYLCSHDLVDEIHITGSDKTYDAIVFGEGEEGLARKLRNEPRLHKPVTSELGNVSPTIVVPGPWSKSDVAFQAEHIATQKLHNGGFNCIASQVLVLPQDWPKTPKLLQQVAAVFSRAEKRPPYYPGAMQRRERMQSFGESGGAANVISVDASLSPAFREEAFCDVLSFTQLPGGIDAYLERAVALANETLWGTLGANLIVHHKTMKRHGAAIQRAIETLRYGTIGVNVWTGVGYCLADIPWGAYPGHSRADIQSGSGVVHNAFLFSRTEKSVVYGPFRPFPRRPPWFITHRRAASVGERLFRYQMHHSPTNLAAVVTAALRG